MRDSFNGASLEGDGVQHAQAPSAPQDSAVARSFLEQWIADWLVAVGTKQHRGSSSEPASSTSGDAIGPEKHSA